MTNDSAGEQLISDVARIRALVDSGYWDLYDLDDIDAINNILSFTESNARFTLPKEPEKINNEELANDLLKVFQESAKYQRNPIDVWKDLALYVESRFNT